VRELQNTSDTSTRIVLCCCVSVRYITLPKDNPNRRRLTCCGCFTDFHAIRILCVSLAPPFCGVSRAVADHHLCSQRILCFAHARTRTGVHCPCLHSHSHFGVSADRQKHHRSRLRRRTHCTARAAALRVVDRTDGFTTRPPSDLSWYLPRASSQRRGLPSSCAVHKFSILRRGQFLCRSR